MTKTLLRQSWCRNEIDHPAHTEVSDLGLAVFRCPGRYTPRLHRAPDPQPRPAEDPFAGIPGAANDEETW
jgi:hypothetical protein